MEVIVAVDVFVGVFVGVKASVLVGKFASTIPFIDARPEPTWHNVPITIIKVSPYIINGLFWPVKTLLLK